MVKKRTAKRWYPRSFEEIAGNDDLKNYGRSIVRRFRCDGEFGNDNALITGKSRSGKSSMVALLKRCLVCTEFDFDNLRPCDLTCDVCKGVSPALGAIPWDVRPPVLAKTKHDPVMIVRTEDCARLTGSSLDDLICEIRRNVGPTDYQLIHFDEIHFLGEKGIDQRLLNPMDEFDSVTWIATSAYVKKGDANVRRQLDEMLQFRFNQRLSTKPVPVDDLAIWSAERCLEFEIKIEPPEESTLRLLAQKAEQTAGHALQILAKAEANSHFLTRRLIDDYKFGF